MAWHEAMRVPTRRGMVCMVLGQQPDVFARTGHVYRVSCTPAHGRRYTSLADERQLGGSTVLDHVLSIQNLRCGRDVRAAGPFGGAVGVACRRRRTGRRRQT